MDELIYADLVKAVRLRSTLLSAKTSHKEQLDEIEEKRKKLLMRATEFIENSPAMDQIYRDIDLLDKQEFDVNIKFRKTIQQSENDINGIVAGIMERRFGPDWNSDSVI